MLGHGARGDPEAAGDLDCGQRLIEEAEQSRSGRTQKGHEGSRVSDGRWDPERRHSATGVRQHRRFLWADGGRGLVSEHRRYEQQPSAGRRDAVSADHLVDVQHAVVPSQIRVHVGEQQAGASHGQSPRTVGHVGFQQQLHLRPHRLDGGLPVLPQELAEGVAESDDRRVVGSGGSVQSPGERVRRVRGQQIAADQIGGGLADDGQFFFEGWGESCRPRRQEVGKGAPRRYQGHEQVGVERAESAENGPAPWEVQRGQSRLAQHPQAEHGLMQGRHGEPRVREVLDPKLKADH